ncbi:uncharacterized protein EI90DRAFT_2571968 [Cantharellus anzutake]|uniref:uncharacterized protein n=1 Tax=Cantharellus anzutake TaxID=1750568 RepID=UPI001907209C|nr:uncharacterized protein EI90DRAFT_2571968 [Cantharellus anzutake]KAF8338319.1 hypothetical protein EI90DRAFT_2571968 [Cantharellus anzutake]
MGLTSAQKQDVLQIIDKLWNHTSGRRLVSQMFRTLPDPVAWKAYYDVIPQPRSLESVKADVEKNKLSNVEQTRTDLDLIFKNA